MGNKTMKLYRATDNYRGKVRWFENKSKAVGQADLWACVLDAEAFEQGRKDFDGCEWVSVDEYSSKLELVLALNGSGENG
jgi:hypothetical protein